MSNLTNLLAFTAAGLTFAHFTAVMAPPWLAAMRPNSSCCVGFSARSFGSRTGAAPDPADVPVFVLVVLALTLIGFAVTSLLGFSPAGRRLPVRSSSACAPGTAAQHVAGIAGAADVPFLAFVLCLGVVVDGLMRHGLDDFDARRAADRDTLPALLGIAVAAAVLSNVVNNLPAVLVLLPLVTGAGRRRSSPC